MELIGLQVKHNKYGIGKIEHIDDNVVVVEFGDQKRSFTYPDAFGKFICCVDLDVQNEIEESMQLNKVDSAQNIGMGNGNESFDLKNCRERSEYIIKSVENDFEKYFAIESKYNMRANEVEIVVKYRTGANRIDRSRNLCNIWVHGSADTDDIKIRDNIYEQMLRNGDINKNKYHHIQSGGTSSFEAGFTFLCLWAYSTQGVIEDLRAILKAYLDLNFKDGYSGVNTVSNRKIVIGHKSAYVNATIAAEELKNSIISSEHLYAYRFTEADCEHGLIARSRFNSDNVKCCYFLYKNGAVNPNNTKRNTYFEVYFNRDCIGLVCCEQVKNILSSIGIDNYKYMNGWDLKYNYEFSCDSDLSEVCQFIVDEYEKLNY